MTIYAVERRNKANGKWELVAFPKTPADNNDLCMRSVAMMAENKDTIGVQYRVMPYARMECGRDKPMEPAQELGQKQRSIVCTPEQLPKFKRVLAAIEAKDAKKKATDKARASNK